MALAWPVLRRVGGCLGFSQSEDGFLCLPGIGAVFLMGLAWWRLGSGVDQVQ